MVSYRGGWSFCYINGDGSCSYKPRNIELQYDHLVQKYCCSELSFGAISQIDFLNPNLFDCNLFFVSFSQDEDEVDLSALQIELKQTRKYLLELRVKFHEQQRKWYNQNKELKQATKLAQQNAKLFCVENETLRNEQRNLTAKLQNAQDRYKEMKESLRNEQRNRIAKLQQYDELKETVETLRRENSHLRTEYLQLSAERNAHKRAAEEWEAKYRAASLITQHITKKTDDPFEILGIQRTTSRTFIQSHYRNLMKAFHPDRTGSDATNRVHFEERSKRINAAYESILNAI